MRKITVVCSSHRENGFSNAAELSKILLAIAPEVVFEERPPSAVASSRELRSIVTLESQAIARYRESRSFVSVPVDRHHMPEHGIVALKREIDSVLDHVEQTSQEYQLLFQESESRACQYGFGYLNSAAFCSVRARMSDIEDEVIGSSSNVGLIRGLTKWRQLTLSRELEMVRAIYDFCRSNEFDVGVFLVGAAHKMGITREVSKYTGADAELIEWRHYQSLA